MVESLEHKVLSHPQQTKQDSSIWNEVIAAILFAGLAVAGAYLVHDFVCSSQYCQVKQEINTYFYQGEYIR